MTAIGLRCDICDVEIGDDPHWPHDANCDGDDCVCAALTCSGCCRECCDRGRPA